MKPATIAVALAMVALFSVSGLASAQDTMNDYRWHSSQGLYPWSPSWDPRRHNCRVVEVRTMNRWGTDLVIHRRICDD
jgi:hypothetical protein